MNHATPILALLLAGCGGLTPLGDGVPATDDTGSSEVSLGALTASPATLAFGEVLIGSTATESITLSNGGDEPLVLKEPLVTGDYGFEVDTTSLAFPLELAAGGEQVLTVTYSPVDETTIAGQVILRVDGEDSTATVDLSGTGSYDVGGGDDGGSESGDDGDGGFSVSPTSIDFGVVDIGDTAAETVYITNDTADDILVTDISSSDGVFAISGEISPPQVLAAGSEKYLTVAYAPTDEVVSNATITVETDSADAPSTDIAVSGEGYLACTICSGVISVDTGGDDDHTVALSDLSCSASGTLTIQNEGDEPLELKDMDYSNDSISTCGSFTAGWSGPTTLDPYDTATIDISYSANEFCIEWAYPSFDQNMLHIYSDDPAEPDYAIELTASVTCLW